MSRSHRLLVAATLSASVLLTAGCASFGTASTEPTAGHEHMRCMGDSKTDPAEQAGADQVAKSGCKMMDRKTESAEPKAAHDHSDSSISSTPPEHTPQ
jgi:hypothetical protein